MMIARIFQFPRRDRGPVRVEHDRDGGEWLVIHDGRAWPHSSREYALREADEIAAQLGATLIVEAPR
jgi:hypothetical protein